MIHTTRSDELTRVHALYHAAFTRLADMMASILHNEDAAELVLAMRDNPWCGDGAKVELPVSRIKRRLKFDEARRILLDKLQANANKYFGATEILMILLEMGYETSEGMVWRVLRELRAEGKIDMTELNPKKYAYCIRREVPRVSVG